MDEIKGIKAICEEWICINPENPFELLEYRIQGMGSLSGPYRLRYTSVDMGKFLKLEFNVELFVLIAETETGAYCSENNGRSWTFFQE
jgi:hypothetical protein